MTPRPADRVYLGWEYALVHPHPGPPPRRPAPPGQERLDPGWLLAQQREERRRSLPLKAGAAAGAGLAGLTAVLGAAGTLNPALTATGGAAFLAVTAWCARGVWRGGRELRAQVAAEEKRVARAQAVQDRRLSGWQEEHARRFRDWEARSRAFDAQRQWYGVALPTGIDRVDVAGGTLAGWSALLAMLAGLRLAAGGQVTVLDLTEGAVAQDLLALAGHAGVNPLVWVLPGDLPRLDLGTGLAGEALADVLAVAAAGHNPAQDPASPPDPVPDRAILERIARILGQRPSLAQMTAGLRILAQIGDPHDDIRRGQISEPHAGAIAALYGRAASDQVITERALGLEARLRTLETLGIGAGHAAAEPPARRGAGSCRGGDGHRCPRRVRHGRAHPPAAPPATRPGLAAHAPGRRGREAPRRPPGPAVGRLRGQRHRAGAGLPLAPSPRPGAAGPGQRCDRVHAARQRRRREGGQ